MRYLLITSLIGFLPLVGFSQNCFQSFYEKGKSAYEALQFETAINQFRAAKVCDDLPVDHQLDEWINKAQNGYIEAIKKEQARAQSLALTAKSIIELTKNNDATKAFRYAQYAWQEEDTPESRLALYDSYYQLAGRQRKNFYIRDIRVFDHVGNTLKTGGFMDKGQTVFVTSLFGDQLFLYDFNGKKIAELTAEADWYTDQAYSEEANVLLATEKSLLNKWVLAYRLKNAMLDTIPLFKYEIKNKEVTALAISKAGDKTVIAFYDGDTHVLNAKGEYLYQLPVEKSGANYLVFSDNNEIAMAYHKKVKVFKLEDNKFELRSEQALDRMRSPKLAFSSSGKYLMAGSRSLLKVFDIEADSSYSGVDATYVPYQSDIGMISKDEVYVTFGHRLNDLKRRKLIKEFSNEVLNMKFSPDLKYLAANMEDLNVQLWKYPLSKYGGIDHGILGGHRDFVRQINFSPDSTHLLTVSNDRTVKVWMPDMTAGVFLNSVGDLSQAIDFGDELRLVSIKNDRAYYFDENGKQQFYTRIPAAKNIVTSASDGKYLLVNDENGFDVWTVDLNEKSVQSFLGMTGGDSISLADFSTDGKLAFYTNENYTYSLRLWDFNTGDRAYLSGYKTDLKAIRWASDNRHIAALDYEGNLFIWKVADEIKLLKKIVPSHDMACADFYFSPDGKNVLTCGLEGTMKIWTLEGKLINSLTGHTNGVRTAAYSPDGKFIISGSDDESVKIWTSNGQLITTLKVNDRPINKVCFSSDGRYIAMGYADETLLILPFDPNLLIQKVEALQIPDLGKEEKERYGISQN